MNTTRTNDDPLSLRYELGAALVAYETAPSPSAAFSVAAALGKTRLFGVNPGPELDGRLPSGLATSAVDGLAVVLPEWKRAVRKLDPGYGDRWRTQGDEDCVALLEHRTDAWGVLVAVREAAQTRPELGGVVVRVQSAIKTFDLWLRSQQDELSAVVGAPLLANWRALLVPPYRDSLPWWLDGTLEAVAERVRQDAAVVVPSTRVGRLLAERLPPPFVGSVGKASDGAGVPFAATHEVLWTSPNGKWVARLELPSAPDDEALPRPINFEPLSEAESARSLPHATPVRLGSAAGSIDASGQFRVSLHQLRTSDQPLEVAGEVWHLEDAIAPSHGSSP